MAPATALLLPVEREPEGEPQDAAARRRRRWWIAGAVLLTLVVAGVLIVLLVPNKSQVTVPPVTGQTQAVATARLSAAGLTAVPTPTASVKAPLGVVFDETPPHGSVVDRGSRVAILVSSGPGIAQVPDVKNLASAEAVSRLTKAGFKPNVESQSSATVPVGKVIATEPSADTEAQAGSPVTVLVSTGPAQVRVPEVTGQSEAEAKASLRAAGLEPGTVTKQEAAGTAAGTVLSQSPAAGSSVNSGQQVSLIVVKASQEVTVPRVVGRKEELAEGELVGAGFKPKTTKRTVTNPEEAGIVLQQSPAGGGKAKRGATVTITVGKLETQTPPSTTTTPPSTTPSTTTAPPAPAGGVAQ